jgi:hypothetical protein
VSDVPPVSTPVYASPLPADDEEEAGVAAVDDLVVAVLHERALLVRARQTLAHDLALDAAVQKLHLKNQNFETGFSLHRRKG